MDKDVKMVIKMNNKSFPDLEKLAKGQAIDESQIIELCDYVDQRLDCADFRLVILIRTYADYESKLSQETVQRIEKTIQGFKYWMDEPGDDSMCYWSENHQAIFASCEYLAGQFFPNERFTNDGMYGRYHMAKAAERLNIWLDLRFRFGFVEWHSNTYYEEDIAPLSLLLDFCENHVIREKAKIIMDLILLDMAMHQYKSYMVATSGRCYEQQKKHVEKQDVSDILQKAFTFQDESTYAYDYSKLSAEFTLNRTYEVPSLIEKIAHDRTPAEIKVSMGLDLDEIKDVFPNEDDVLGRGMYLWSMESFSNPESCNIAHRLYHEWKLESNDFLKNLGALDVPVISRIGLLPTAIKVLNPVTRGISIQRVNSYSYRTEDYFLSSAQQYHPGDFGDQQHIWQATIGSGISVFTTHPGAAFFEENARNFSPSYWVGNGINPDCRQHKNVLLCAYDLSVRKGFMEKKRQLFTHAYFPFTKFDDVVPVHDKLICAREGQSYLALFSLEDMEIPNPQDGKQEEIIQRGKWTAWACVLGSESSYTSFENFITTCKSSAFTSQGKSLEFTLSNNPEYSIDQQSKGSVNYRLHYAKDFSINGMVQEKEYSRIDSPYGIVERDPKTYHLEFAGEKLDLSWPTQLYDPMNVYLSDKSPYETIRDLSYDVVMRIDPNMKWMWGEALFGYALTLLDDYRGTDDFTPFLTRYCQYWLEHRPKIDYADRIAPALISYAMEKKTGNTAFNPLTAEALDYIKNEPRLLEDAVNHFGRSFESKLYPQSIWVDSLMMFSVFPSLYAAENNDIDLLEFAARQPEIYARYLQDEESSLWLHSYWTKAKRNHPKPPVFWGRGNGWVVSSLPMIMENIGASNKHFPKILKIFRKTVDALLPYQNTDGSFNTIITKDSYREMSATALIAAGILHAVRVGYLEKKYLVSGLKALDAVISAISCDEKGAYLDEISAPTIPLQVFPALAYRLTPKQKNWSYGLAAAIFAAIEYKKLEDLGMLDY